MIAIFSKIFQEMEQYLIGQQDSQERRKYESLHVVSWNR